MKGMGGSERKDVMDFPYGSDVTLEKLKILFDE